MVAARIDPTLRVCLLSDMHIGDGSRTDPFGPKGGKKDELLRRFLDEEAARADAVVIVGDGFDLAQAWTMERIVDGHRRLVDDLAALARTGALYYVAGNHEGSVEPIARALPGAQLVERLRIGDDVLVEHGHAFDPYNQPGDRAAFWKTRAHATLERIIGSPVRIPMRKHYCWSTRLGHWVFYRYGQLQAALADRAHRRGAHDDAARRHAFLDYWGRGEWGDANGLLEAARTVVRGATARVLICGHSHQAGRVELDGGSYLNTGTWSFDDASYAVYDGARDGLSSVHRWPDRSVVGDEEYRGVLGPHRGKSFFDWWEQYYLGWLRYDVEAMGKVC